MVLLNIEEVMCKINEKEKKRRLLKRNERRFDALEVGSKVWNLPGWVKGGGCCFLRCLCLHSG
jgi:hypothetical protein